MGIAPIPKIPSISSLSGENGPEGIETICADCGKTISQSAACDNPSCSRMTGKKLTRPKNKPDDEGKNPRLKEHVVTFKGAPVNVTHVPGFSLAAQSNIPVQQNVQPIAPLVRKPIPKKVLISDDDAQISDVAHLGNVEHSANHLGL